MDSNNVKANLKSARDAIKQKDFKGAINLCKAVLSADRSNYNGLVLLGAALQETEQKDQAEKAFKKAIAVAPNQVLAYQGLSSYYEKILARTVDQDKELINAYQKMLTFDNDNTRFEDLCRKLSQLVVSSLGIEKCVEVLTALKLEGSDKQQVVDKSIFDALLTAKDLPVSLENMLGSYLEKYIKSEASTADEKFEYYKRYLKFLYKLKNIDLLVNEAKHCASTYPAAEYPLEWLLKVFSEQVANGCAPTLSDAEVTEYFNQLTVLNPGSTMALMARGAQQFTCGDFSEAVQTLKQVVANSQLPYALVFLCQCQTWMHCFSEAATNAKRAISSIMKHEPDNEYLINLLNTELAEALSRLDTIEANAEAIALCNNLLQAKPHHPETTIILSRVLLRDDSNKSQVYEIMDEHESNPAYTESQSSRLQAMYLQANHNLVDAERVLKNAVAKTPTDSQLWLMLGEVSTELGHQEAGMQALLKATKLNPHCSTCYLRLGQQYSEASRDLDKARRCFLKALQLNPQSHVASKGLAEVYNLTGNKDGCVQLLQAATTLGGDNKWAWLQLGMIQFGKKDYEQAINSLVAAIRADPNDSHCWSALGDAYAARGSFNSALRSYQRVMELDGKASYPILQMGNIKLKLGLLNEAEQQFCMLSDTDVGYLPALKGLAETYLSQARDSLERQLLGRSKVYCQQAVDVLARAIDLRRDLSCMWKLVGEVMLVASRLPQISLHISPVLLDGNTVSETLQKGDLLSLGARCYCRVLSLCNDIGSLVWHDLAVNYHLQAANATEKEHKALCNERGLASAKKAVEFNANSWQHWNILGIVAATQDPPNYRLAQHAFIRSVQSTGSNPVPWTNLGVVYLSAGSLKLANQAFRQAQRAEPGYVEAWIGQATIAEMAANDDAMDLFRHTTELGIHRESCIGYASWVCTTLQLENCKDYNYVIEKMHAITVATDCLTWYTALVPDDSCAFNMLGILLERQGLHGRAAAAFETAVRLLSDPEKLDAVRTNYARVLVVLGRCQEAIQQYQLIKTASFVTHCGLALAYFNAEMYEESHNTYESALHWLAPSDAFKSHVLVAMAAMVYMFQGMEEAQTLLYQCITLKPASVQGLFAMCSLGLLHSDINLSQLVLTELESYTNDVAFITDIAVFKAYTHYLQNQSLEAIRVLCKSIHTHPGSSGLWLALALLLLQENLSENAKSAGRCANKSIALGRGTLDVSKIMYVVSLSELLSGKVKASLRSSQKAVHMYPDTVENWAVLIAASLSQSFDATWVSRVIEHVRTQMKSSRPLNKWLINNLKKLVQEGVA